MRFIKAQHIFNGKLFLPADALLVFEENGTLIEIANDTITDAGKIEVFQGILSPGFVNSHCHLELSHLLGKIPTHTGLPEFAKAVIQQRNLLTVDQVTEQIEEADKRMWGKGIVAVGDISNTGISFNVKSQSDIFYHTFVELIGLNPLSAETAFKHGLSVIKSLKDQNLAGSLAPHAPYSTSRELIEKIAAFNHSNDTTLSIHNQESEEENKFFHAQKNGFDDLYKFLNLDLSWFKAPMCSSLKSYADLLEPVKSMLVHNTMTTEADLRLILNKHTFWCFCVNANLYIENSLPDFKLFKNHTKKLCLGTDSLASNTQLDMTAEINTLLNNSDVFSLPELLCMITSNGAAALDISDNFGNLIPKKNTGLNLIEYKNSQIQFIKKIF